MKLLIILGNQLFDCSYLNKLKDHEVFMCEDYDLCTYEKHHKQKILFFLSSISKKLISFIDFFLINVSSFLK